MFGTFFLVFVGTGAIVINDVSNGAITYQLDGLQYVLVGAGDTLWAFVMNE